MNARQSAASGSTAITVGLADTPSDLRDVFLLAKESSGTLGFLRNEAFTDRLRHQGLVVAKREGSVVGYILYDLPKKGHIKLVHVCVGSAARGTGLAKVMLDYVVKLNPQAVGIYAACRSDYGIDEFWIKLGLIPKRRIPGRAAKGSVLVQWWRQVGQLDLFESSIATAATPLAALDTNVVADLFGSAETPRPTREQSLPLLTSWVTDAVEFVVSNEADVENHRNPDQAEAQYRFVQSEHLPRLRSSRPDDRALEDALLDRIGGAALIADPSLHQDVHHLADAIRNDVTYFITHDESLIKAVEAWITHGYSLKVMRPHELISSLIEPKDRGHFRSRVIESIDMAWVPAAELDIIDLGTTFRAPVRGETPRSTSHKIRELLAHAPDVATGVLVDGKRKPLAIMATSTGVSSLDVRLLRVAGSRDAPTIASQLARQVRERAVAANISLVIVHNDATDPVTRSALTDDGFQLHTGHLRGFVAPRVLTFEAASRWVTDQAVGVNNDPVTLEKSLWPLTIIDADLPTFIVPIQPRFAESLFGYQTDVLFHNREKALGLSREHVYFHAAGSTPIPAGPARLLWYVTYDETTTSRTVAVASRTLETRTLPADVAHRMFSQIGTLRRNNVRDVANKKGMVHVIRFEDSTVFDAPLDRARLRVLLRAYGIKEPIQSLRRVPTAFFTELFKLSSLTGANT